VITNKKKVRAVYIGLGSNIEQPYAQIKNAMLALNKLPDTKVLMNSGYYISKPMGPEDQPDYVNAVVEIETLLDATELLKNCQLIEQQQGRIKTRHWGERSIDLDVLLYADQQILSDNLTLPHPGICHRDFVYMPLLKLNPELEIPGKGMLNRIIETEAGVASDFSCQFAGPITGATE
jgi:2-amino-4-hydroxy-6-hydroxymethyldihydropteridine diphosphokinase